MHNKLWCAATIQSHSIRLITQEFHVREAGTHAARVHLCSLLQRVHAADDSVLGCGLAEFVYDGPESCVNTRRHSRYQAQRTNLSDSADAITAGCKSDVAWYQHWLLKQFGRQSHHDECAEPSQRQSHTAAALDAGFAVAGGLWV